MAGAGKGPDRRQENFGRVSKNWERVKGLSENRKKKAKAKSKGLLDMDSQMGLKLKHKPLFVIEFTPINKRPRCAEIRTEGGEEDELCGSGGIDTEGSD
jgi:hypothetical protein